MEKEKLIDLLISQSNKIYFYCLKRCSNKMDAEDLSQEIIMNIIININKGIQIENFDYYIWQVCKNYYSKFVDKKVKERQKIVNLDSIDDPADSINLHDTLIKNEQIEMINKAIKSLTSDYSEILYSYYIEDKSLASISSELNLPLGTIKRRLFDIRNKLKEHLKMERLNGKKAFVPKKFSTAMSGSGEINPHQFTKSLINKNILFHSYDNPCTLEDYSLELGISMPYIEEIVEELVHATLLKKDKNKYITDFPILTKENEILLSNIIKERGKVYGQMLVEFAKKHFIKFKEIINNCHFTDNELMWVFMFYINRIVEKYPINKGDNWIEPKYRHVDSEGSWDFQMLEDYESEKTYPINENWFGNPNLGIQGICHPACCYESDEDIFKTICYNKCVNGTGDLDNLELDYIEYVIKNPSMKFSKIEKSQKYKVEFLIDNNYLYVVNDELKFNFVLLNHSQYAMINSYFEYNADLKVVKEVKSKIIKEMEKNITIILPTYLSDDAKNLASGYFYGFIREYVIRAFAENGLIKPNYTNKRFNFNMYAWTFKDEQK